jgi:hypothetical protein
LTFLDFADGLDSSSMANMFCKFLTLPVAFVFGGVGFCFSPVDFLDTWTSLPKSGSLAAATGASWVGVVLLLVSAVRFLVCWAFWAILPLS